MHVFCLAFDSSSTLGFILLLLYEEANASSGRFQVQCLIRNSVCALATALLVSVPAWSQRVEVTDMTEVSPDQPQDQRAPAARPSHPVGRRYSQGSDAPPTGRAAAQKYMGAGASGDGATRAPAQSGTSAAHYLALHVGAFVSDDAYKWGRENRVADVGNFTAGVTYRVGEWVNSMDLAIRLDFSTYDLPAGDATKISIVPLILFPDASSRFPLYFGGGLGAGVMAKTTPGESALALEYQLLLGVRFFEVIETTGFFVEAGIKNHLHLFSDGQFNGQFIAAGAVFTF